MLKSLKQVSKLSKKFNIPSEDILLIALNCCGLRADIGSKRLRFKMRLNSLPNQWFYLAVCVNTGKTPFVLRQRDVFLNNEKIGTIKDMENDTCDTTYFRRNKTVLNINSNSRSDCRGCKFCGTYNQEASDKAPLSNQKELNLYLNRKGITNWNKIKEIAICTGCFPTESKLISHLLMINKFCQAKQISPNIKYIGSQIINFKTFIEIKKNINSFSYYLTLDCFMRRHFLLRPAKAKIDIERAVKIIDLAAENNFHATFLYILGLDSLKAIEKNFQLLQGRVNCFPVINLMQNFLLEQEDLRHQQAKKIEYYLKARKLLEKIFSSTKLRPILWENYRGLWYTRFDQEVLSGIRI